MQGARNLRKPCPRYPITWNAKDLLTFLQNWNLPNDCSLKDLSAKLVTLLACLTVQRVHTLSLIDSRFIKFTPNATYVYVFEDLKVTRQRPYFILSLPGSEQTDSLKTAQLLSNYLTRTTAIRKKLPDDCDKHKLFLSYVPPHKPVKTETLARWIRGVMQDSGIDINVFGAHSVRGAAASAARIANAPVDDILRAGDWSSLNTFNRHYFRNNAFLPSTEIASLLTSLTTTSE